jgi:hypothetical protein
MVPREMGRYMTTSTGLHTGRLGWSSRVAEGERKSHGKTGSKSDCGSYIDPTLRDYIRCGANNHRQTRGLVI